MIPLLKKCWLPLIICAITGFFLLGQKSFWFDEAYTIYFIKNPNFPHSLWVVEPNMWLYYLLLYLWAKLGNGDLFYRSLSVLFGLGTIPVVYKVGEYLFDRKVAKIATIFLALNVFFVFYLQETRSYSLALLLVSLSSYLFLRSRENPKFSFLYIFVSALSVYAHLYGALIILSQYVSLLFSQPPHRRRYLANLLSITILVLPLFLAPAIRTGVANWILRPPLVSLFGTLFLLSGDFPPLATIFLLLISFQFLKLQEWKHRFLLSWLFTPIIASFIFSSVVKPIYQSVYFIPVLPAFLLLAADSLQRVKSKLVYKLVLFLILLFSCVRLYLWYSGNTRFVWVIKNLKEDWRGATTYIQSHAQPNDGIIFYGYFAREPYEYYTSALVPTKIEVASSYYIAGAGDRLPEPNLKLLSSLPEHFSRIWLLTNRSDGDSFNRAQQRQEIETILEKEYTYKASAHFYRVNVEVFSNLP